MILFLSSSKFCLVFYQIYLKNIRNTFMHLTVFTIVRVFLYTVDTEGGDGATNLAQLGSDYSEPGKHV